MIMNRKLRTAVITTVVVLSVGITGISMAGLSIGFGFGGGGGGGNEIFPDEQGGQGRYIDLGKAARSASDAFGNVSPEEERAIGKQGSAVLLGAAPLAANDRAQRYVNRVGRWVASQTEQPDLKWRFGILDTDSVNSFAAPGGYVFITKGLLKRLDNEAELAAILAHECAHVIKHHHLRAIKKTGAVDLASTLVSAAVKTNNRAVLNQVMEGSKTVYARGLDKGDEYEADQMAAVITARAGYEPFGLHEVMQKLAAIRPDDNSLSLLFATHPPPDKRLQRLDNTLDPLASFTGKPTLRTRYRSNIKGLR
jgi:predicted Zn-dependent protease